LYTYRTPHVARRPRQQPYAKVADPNTPRPDDVEFNNKRYTNPKYAGFVWYIADHIRDPTKPIIPLAALRPADRQLNADFIDTISAALDHDDKRPADRVRHGHRNLSLCSLTSVVAANWAAHINMRRISPNKSTTKSKINGSNSHSSFHRHDPSGWNNRMASLRV